MKVPRKPAPADREGLDGRQARGLRTAASLLGALAAALALAAGTAALALGLAARPAPGIGGGAIFTVSRGEGASEVGEALAAKGLLRSARAFGLLARLEGKGAGIKAGNYRIEPGMGAQAILDLLVSGKQALARVTVPEGFTLGQVASLLERYEIAGKGAFLAAARSRALLDELGIPADSAEGYLFPDTYYLPAGSQPEGVVRLMVAAFRQRLATIPEAAALSPAELHDRIILASIVEREYKEPAEAPLMASVFYNRLKIRMALQSCATIVYVLTERMGKPHPEVIYDRDLELDDPYNTYKHRGLTPGPISNPGLTALEAAFRPASTRYLYFRLVDPAAGTHHFSSTLEEHLDARNLFIKKVGS